MPEPTTLTETQRYDMLRECLKPEEISDHRSRPERVREVLLWFARFAHGMANPKWLRGHAFELAFALDETERALIAARAEVEQWRIAHEEADRRAAHAHDRAIAAEAERNEARAEREGWRDAHQRACDARDEAEGVRRLADAQALRALMERDNALAAAAEQRARAERMEGALWKHGRHAADCAALTATWPGEAPCTCGYRAALAGGRGEG